MEPPNCFTDQFLGIDIKLNIVFRWLAIVMTILHFALVRLITVFVRRRYSGDDLSFLEVERRRLNRGILLVTIGIALLVSLPMLDFDPEIENVVNQIAISVGAVGIHYVAYRDIDIFIDALAKRTTETESKLDDSLVPWYAFRRRPRTRSLVTDLAVAGSQTPPGHRLLSPIGVLHSTIGLALPDRCWRPRLAPTQDSSPDHSEPNQVARSAAYSMSTLSNLFT